METQKNIPNRLIKEKSPYLLQHAYNPVDWYPWGQEAFDRAKRERKPVFLSIGYSTCHWCHVMERESFEDQETAAALNRDFISIKVDREERPDVDAVYMAACQAVTGSGGWPLTILMTPEQKPFWAGTYLPKHSRYGQPGLIELLAGVVQLWKKSPKKLLQQGDAIAGYLNDHRESENASPNPALLHQAPNLLKQRFDPQNGGFGPAPKFPTPHNLLFLMAFAGQENDGEALQMAEKTLLQMARGGLFDQIGGGFSRYSTDEKWLAPHFEKMLYDNALLAYAYLEAFERTGNPFYETVARRTLDYVLRELRHPEGGFYCGQDADSDGVEGLYYLLTPAEVKDVLGTEAGEAFCRWFDITNSGNFEGKSIPNLLQNPQYAQRSPEIAGACEKIRQYRLQRTKLHTDDKILTSWNALMLAALAKAYRVLGDPKYLEAAEQTRDFLQARLFKPDGRLYLRWRDGEAAHDGQLDDYAFLCWALLLLYGADFDPSCLDMAVQLAEQMETSFWDRESGGFFLTAHDAEQLIARPKELYDGAMPSGNSAAALALVLISRHTGEPHRQELADRQLSYIAGNIQDYPAGYTFSLLAFCEALFPSRELICACAEKPPAELRELCEIWGLHAIVKTRHNEQMLIKTAPFTASYPIPKQGEAYYLCQNGTCRKPVYSLQDLDKSLKESFRD